MPETVGASLPDDEMLQIGLQVDRGLPVSDQVYEALKQAIIKVKLLPGSLVSENRICRHFGVSRTPARTALVRLAEDGLIDVFPRQGVSLRRSACAT